MPPEHAGREPPAPDRDAVRSARVVLACDPLQPTVDFLTERLGFRLESIAPADDPRTACLSGHGLQLELRRGTSEAPGTLRLLIDGALPADGPLVAPNGTRVEFAPFDPPPAVPPLEPAVVLRRARDADWVAGRAGMRYRDLVPGRLGGHLVASRIEIPDGGPVPDAVHYHLVRFQLIRCLSGWVRVAYEGQGPPLVMRPGDCVLQPPRIRHRVLECSPGLAVVEVACPAEHETRFDHELELPTATTPPARRFDGQRFVHHVAAEAPWTPADVDGFLCRDTGLAEATGGLVGARTLRPADAAVPPAPWRHHGELLFLHVVAGDATMRREDGEDVALSAGDSVCLPAGPSCAWHGVSRDLELFEVRVAAAGG